MSKNKCSRLVYHLGTCVFVTDTISPDDMGGWLKNVRQKAGRFAWIDWNYFGGRIRVIALGRIGKVEAAIRELKSEHDRLWRKAMGHLGSYFEPPSLSA